MRKTHTLAELNPKKDIVELHKLLNNIFNEAKKFVKKNPTEEQKKKKKLLDKKLEKIINYQWKSEEAKSIVKNWLKKFEGHWLTAIEISGVELTNNKTERYLRGTIPTRKLLGCHRTEEGAKYFAIIQSHRLTWKIRGLSPFKEMAKKLREINMNQAL